jgi:hypothetical protein
MWVELSLRLNVGGLTSKHQISILSTHGLISYSNLHFKLFKFEYKFLKKKANVRYSLNKFLLPFKAWPMGRNN